MNELIYKQDAKDAVDIALDTIDHVPEWVYDILLNSLDKVQSAQPERKKGYWIKKEPTIKELHGCYYECSKCHKFSLPFQKLNFCPNCGADMRGEQNDTD